jgi:hypothetical protein
MSAHEGCRDVSLRSIPPSHTAALRGSNSLAGPVVHFDTVSAPLTADISAGFHLRRLLTCFPR